MSLRMPQAVPTTNDVETIAQALRRSLLMQVRWIEDHPATDPQTNEYLAMLRRSQLQLVRAIETHYHIAPKRRKVKTRRR